MALYQKVRVPEYLLVNTPRSPEGAPISFKGYRLAADRRYRPLEPDAQGRLLSETTELLFGVSADASRIEVYDARTGERLQTPDEAVAKADRAEAARRREAAARKAAEEELDRLRAEIERLRR